MNAGQDQQRHPVGLGGEDLHALEAEGHRPGGRSRRQPQREQREADRAGVGEHVPGVREQRERVREHADRHLDGHEGEDQRERRLQPAAAGVGVDGVSVRGVLVGHRLTIRAAADE